MSEQHRIRYKEHKCTYPGCCEPAKTKYNCISHVWDGHLKLLQHEHHGIAYKNLKGAAKKEAKQECLKYITSVTDNINKRKRRPYKTSALPTKPEPNDVLITQQQTDNFIAQQQTDDFLTIQINNTIGRLCVAGDIFSESGFFQRSDERYKTDIQQIAPALQQIREISGYSFVYKSDLETQKYGFMAQELQKIFPDAVHPLSDGSLTVDVVALLPRIISALQELHGLIAKLSEIDDVLEEIDEIVESVLDQQIDDESLLGSYGLGPRYLMWYVALGFTILSLLEIMLIPNAGSIWFWTVLVAFASWFSYYKCDWDNEAIRWCVESLKGKQGDIEFVNGQRNKWKNIVSSVLMRWGILFSLGICSLALTYLMGETLQIFISIFVSATLLISGIQIIDSKHKYFCLIAMVVLLGIGILTLCILAIVQPSYTCVLSTSFVSNQNPILFIKEQPPWNCMAPSLVSNSTNLSVDYTKPFAMKYNGSGDNIAHIDLLCKNGVKFSCGNVVLFNK